MENEVCDICGKEIPIQSISLHKIHCERNTIKCSQCGQPISKSDKEQHDITVHAPKTCPHCFMQFETRFFDQHVCPKAPKFCQYCEGSIPNDEYNDHYEMCANRTEMCPTCKKYIPLKNYQKHIQERTCLKKVQEEEKRIVDQKRKEAYEEWKEEGKIAQNRPKQHYENKEIQNKGKQENQPRAGGNRGGYRMPSTENAKEDAKINRENQNQQQNPIRENPKQNLVNNREIQRQPNARVNRDNPRQPNAINNRENPRQPNLINNRENPRQPNAVNNRDNPRQPNAINRENPRGPDAVNNRENPKPPQRFINQNARPRAGQIRPNSGRGQPVRRGNPAQEISHKEQANQRPANQRQDRQAGRGQQPNFQRDEELARQFYDEELGRNEHWEQPAYEQDNYFAHGDRQVEEDILRQIIEQSKQEFDGISPDEQLLNAAILESMKNQ